MRYAALHLLSKKPDATDDEWKNAINKNAWTQAQRQSILLSGEANQALIDRLIPITELTAEIRKKLEIPLKPGEPRVLKEKTATVHYREDLGRSRSSGIVVVPPKAVPYESLSVLSKSLTERVEKKVDFTTDEFLDMIITKDNIIDLPGFRTALEKAKPDQVDQIIWHLSNSDSISNLNFLFSISTKSQSRKNQDQHIFRPTLSFESICNAIQTRIDKASAQKPFSPKNLFEIMSYPSLQNLYEQCTDHIKRSQDVLYPSAESVRVVELSKQTISLLDKAVSTLHSHRDLINYSVSSDELIRKRRDLVVAFLNIKTPLSSDFSERIFDDEEPAKSTSKYLLTVAAAQNNLTDLQKIKLSQSDYPPVLLSLSMHKSLPQEAIDNILKTEHNLVAQSLLENHGVASEKYQIQILRKMLAEMAALPSAPPPLEFKNRAEQPLSPILEAAEEFKASRKIKSSFMDALSDAQGVLTPFQVSQMASLLLRNEAPSLLVRTVGYDAITNICSTALSTLPDRALFKDETKSVTDDIFQSIVNLAVKIDSAPKPSTSPESPTSIDRTPSHKVTP